VGMDSSIDIETRYGLDGPRIASRWGRDLFRLTFGSTLPPVQWYSVFPGIKRPGRGISQSLSSSAEFKGRVEFIVYSTSGLPWSVLG
jgi:hypothetical protein